MLAIVTLLTILGGRNVQASDVTLKSGKWEQGTLTAETTKQYYKINIKKTGYIKVEYVRDNVEADADFSFCNSKKKTLLNNSGEVDYKRTSYIAVKKGTYYVCINDSANGEWGNFDEEPDTNIVEGYKIKYTFSAMKEAKRTTKLENASTIKKNKMVSGVVFPGKKKVFCYKFTVPKKSKIKFNYEVMSACSGTGLWLRIADANAQYLEFQNHKVVKNDDNIVWWEGKGNDYVTLKKGTYYFVIQASKNDSGYFKLKLK